MAVTVVVAETAARSPAVRLPGGGVGKRRARTGGSKKAPLARVRCASPACTTPRVPVARLRRRGGLTMGCYRGPGPQKHQLCRHVERNPLQGPRVGGWMWRIVVWDRVRVGVSETGGVCQCKDK
ncbi:hypothetical protein PR202_ga27966 [Eleusine coracana subsp. coracana]|uniref:Uncharacterized protein n=1 Tax=Eleusine coracana subsp. coracana TaxID=191504 RepID=A0AAV5DII1_ELECO|nr:hypothetical protein PR202_ga27966 [Eleusine coracana subsp. coracana]